MEILFALSFVIDIVADRLFAEISEVDADGTATWVCGEGICVDQDSVQVSPPWVYMTVKIPGETDQMYVDIDCSIPMAYIRGGRNRVKHGLPDSVCDLAKR